MTPDQLTARLELVPKEGGGFRVTARESTDLEFKREMTDSIFRKSLKTIAAFANKTGGWIVFGVSDNPRLLVGVGDDVLDEGRQSEQIAQAISPIPTTRFHIVEIHEYILGVLTVSPLPKPPSIAICDIAGGQGGGQVLRKGTVYTRRSGQTAPITGEEFSQLLNSRDERIRNEIFSYLERGRDIGFDRVVVASPRSDAENDEQEMTFYLPASAASDMNVIDEGTLVQDGGAPAYKLVRKIHLAALADNDPRDPMRTSDAVNEMRPSIVEVFGDRFPWVCWHLRKAAVHLGFWNDKEGDKVNTGVEPITRTTLYYAKGREAVMHFARQTPDDFVEVVASKATKDEWRRAQDPVAEEEAAQPE